MQIVNLDEQTEQRLELNRNSEGCYCSLYIERRYNQGGGVNILYLAHIEFDVICSYGVMITYALLFWILN